MKNSILRFGFYGGIAIILLALAPWVVWGTSMSYSTAEAFGYLAIFLSLSSVFFAIQHYRDSVNDGFISFGQALKTGILTTLIPSLFMFAWTIVFFTVWGVEFKDWANSEMQKTMTAPNSFRLTPSKWNP